MPISLTYFIPGTKGYEPKRPDAVVGTNSNSNICPTLIDLQTALHKVKILNVFTYLFLHHRDNLFCRDDVVMMHRRRTLQAE